MKISVCGKGGSGKSTMVALLANVAQKKGYRVLVVDADESNSGLFRMLGLAGPPTPLMDLVGGKESLKAKMGNANILSESHIVTDDIPNECLLQRNRIKFVAIGKILQSLEGCACPMGVLSREFLKKLTLQDDELVIVDMEAGVEHFGRGVDTSIDSVLIVIEPPLESINVGQKIHELAIGMGVKNVWGIINKSPSLDVVIRLKKELRARNIDIAGVINFDSGIFYSSMEGVIPDRGSSVIAAERILDTILPEFSLLRPAEYAG
jgi:CO dehydrogenase maturation factor